MDSRVYFKDQMFSAGRTDIYNESQEKVGKLDLKSAFTSSMSVENAQGELLVEGSFPFLSGKWLVKTPDGPELGRVRAAFTFFSKKYYYDKDYESFEIESPAFSREYTILNAGRQEVASFKKVNGFFQSAAFELNNVSDSLLTEELIAVVMGVNEIEKRRRNASANGGA
ncbi:hypothetical protein WQ57_04620 [Mesobacillus campisalis]|uniref:Uncharacterized protein n=1 Tax=Mesobacillus campisalis TaxID=1408103 RepID=A0A0M2SY20_9BACI|nr:hypothetical protein [Mesobacillus campisalis]KKK39073.1 hypothetical protein WQ57_04620 [Mesobacillus campisalis]